MHRVGPLSPFGAQILLLRFSCPRTSRRVFRSPQVLPCVRVRSESQGRLDGGRSESRGRLDGRGRSPVIHRYFVCIPVPLGAPQRVSQLHVSGAFFGPERQCHESAHRSTCVALHHRSSGLDRRDTPVRLSSPCPNHHPEINRSIFFWIQLFIALTAVLFPSDRRAVLKVRLVIWQCSTLDSSPQIELLRSGIELHSPPHPLPTSNI